MLVLQVNRTETKVLTVAAPARPMRSAGAPPLFVSRVRTELRRDIDWPNAFAVWFSSVHFGRMRGQNHCVSLRFNTASVDIINFENKLVAGTR